MNDDTGGSRDRRRARILAVDVAGIALLPNGGQDTAAQLNKDLSQALKFVTCMRSHGIPKFADFTVQDSHVVIRGGGGFGPGSPQVQSAQQACRSLNPGGGS